MGRKLEGRKQDAFLNLLRREGCACQKFNDLFSEGISDMLVKFALPVESPHGGTLLGAWIELKALAAWPKRDSTRIPKKALPTEGQMRWMKAFATHAFPCWVLIFTPDGWIAVDHSCVEYLSQMVSSHVKKLCVKREPTIGALLRGIYADPG